MINYVTGDLFNAVDSYVSNDGQKTVYIAHCCNDIGKMGRGFVVPLMKKYSFVEKQYKDAKLKLGENQVLQVISTKVRIANMIGQKGITSNKNKYPIRYFYLALAMNDLANTIRYNREYLQDDGIIYCPRFGAGLAGGDWSVVENLIEDIWGDIDVTVFTLPDEVNKFSNTLTNSEEDCDVEKRFDNYTKTSLGSVLNLPITNDKYDEEYDDEYIVRNNSYCDNNHIIHKINQLSTQTICGEKH